MNAPCASLAIDGHNCAPWLEGMGLLSLDARRNQFGGSCYMEALESNSDALSKSYDSARRVRPRRNQFRGSCYMEALESKNDALAKSYDSARRVRPCARAPPSKIAEHRAPMAERRSRCAER